MFYNHHRVYDPKTERYLTPDPVGIMGHVEKWKAGLSGGLGATDQVPLEINPYAYVLSNPLKWIDPEGLRSGGAGGSGAGTRPGGRPGGSGGAKQPGISINEGNKALLGLIELLDPPRNPPGCVISFEYECPPPDDGTCPAYPRHEATTGAPKPLSCLQPRLVVRCR